MLYVDVLCDMIYDIRREVTFLSLNIYLKEMSLQLETICIVILCGVIPDIDHCSLWTKHLSLN